MADYSAMPSNCTIRRLIPRWNVSISGVAVAFGHVWPSSCELSPQFSRFSRGRAGGAPPLNENGGSPNGLTISESKRPALVQQRFVLAKSS